MSKPFFRIEMLPALQGDALWIEYGEGDITRRILIDGGPLQAYPALEKKIKAMPQGNKRIELIVITHIDTDHIEGIIRLFAEKRDDWGFLPKDIWFNGWDHLKPSRVLGGPQGDYLSALIHKRSPDEWNHAFSKGAVVVLPESLPSKTLADGMKITLLSPTSGQLSDLAVRWSKDIGNTWIPGNLEQAWEALVKDTRYKVNRVLGGATFQAVLKKQLTTDPSLANAASIAFLAEYRTKRCLFLGDAHADTICQSIKQIIEETGEKKMRVDAVKVSHHGSRSNISKELIELIDAKHFLISTDGRNKHLKHPNKVALQAIIQWSTQEPIFWFNYESQFNEEWRKRPEQGVKGWQAKYPEENTEGKIVDLFGV